MFGLFKKKQAPLPEHTVTARLNAKLQPLQRGEEFEDPLDDLLQAEGLGQVTGGGTQLAAPPYGIEFCDIEIAVHATGADVTLRLCEMLNGLGAPKGSSLIFDDERAPVPFGRDEGLALFLNGTDLPDEVYAESDVNQIISECNHLMGEAGQMKGYWEGPRETALFFYGTSYQNMKTAIDPFIASDPGCQLSRFEQIA